MAGAGRSERLTLRDRLLVTPAWLHDQIVVKTEGIDSLLDACFTGRRNRLPDIIRAIISLASDRAAAR